MAKDPADDVLQQYATCDDPQRAETLLEELVVEHAQPGIRRIVRYKLAFQGASESQDIEDVASEVVLELIARLRAMREEPGGGSIGAFAGYTAVAAYHACNEYLRRKYPNRHRLKTRLRYLLNTAKPLAIWESQRSVWMCGLAKWQAAGTAPVSGEVVNRWSEHLAGIPHGRRGLHPEDLLAAIFQRFGGPVEFEDLVGIMSEIWGVDDPPPAPEKAARELESGDAGPALRMELDLWMKELWGEIRELPEGQRAALLLNLRCGAAGSAVALLPLTGVATMREIAAVLGFSPEDFAQIWNRLPLDDLAIAERLGVTRQKVINWRKAARERLSRRMSGKNPLP